MEASTAERTGTAAENGTHPAGLDPEEAAAQAQELVIDAGGQISLAVGGKRPTSASLRIVGGKFDVEGQFDKGQIVHIEMDLAITEVAFRDHRDPSTGQVTGCDRAHKGRPIGGVSVSQ